MKVIKSCAPARAFVPFELTLFFEHECDENLFEIILGYAKARSLTGTNERTLELIQSIRNALDGS